MVFNCCCISKPFRVSCWVFMLYFLYFEFSIFYWYDVRDTIFLQMCQGVSCFTLWIYSPWWIFVWNNICGIVSFTVIHPCRWYGMFHFFPSTLGGRVSTLRGGVVSSFIGWFYFSFRGEKISADLYNASIWVSLTLWNGVGGICSLHVSIR